MENLELGLELELIPPRQTKKGRPVIGFGKSGLINISATFVEKQDMKAGEYVAIAKDKSSKDDWYLLHSKKDRQGFIELRQKDTALSLNCSAWAKMMIEQFPVQGKSGVGFLLSQEPVGLADYNAYAIITKSAH